jgi:hypothetical protein
MLPYLLLIVSMLCRAHRGRRSVARSAGLAGMLLALGLAVNAAGVERGVASWLAGVLAGGALAPMILLVLEQTLGRRVSTPGALRHHSVTSVK